MRFENTPALDLALQRAAGYARRAGADATSPLHLLLGLLGDDEGQPALLLTRAGLRREELRQLGLIEEASADPTGLPLAADTRRIFTRAAELAVLNAAEGSLSTDQVLLALVEQADDIRNRLATIGLDVQSLLGAVDPAHGAIALDEPLDLRPPADEVNAARILDAAANRAREALRVLEDHTRFVRNDGVLSARLKQMRHDLAAAVEHLPAKLLLAARDTEHDVGTTISTEREGQRESLAAVLHANARRLQEALRSLEEFGKLFGADFGQSIERLRYDSYTLEKTLLLGEAARERLADCRLYVLVTEALCRASLAGTVREACLGGAQIIQLREKSMDDRRLLELAREVRRITREAGVLFIVNDRPDIAVLAEADGVHLGQDDLPVQAARRIMGPDALIGVSTHNLDQLRQAILDGASYVGIGPTFPSQTKEFAAFAGLDFIRQASAETSLPAFALGGITLDNLAQVLAAGAMRVAVSHSVCGADDPRRAAAVLRRAFDG